MDEQSYTTDASQQRRYSMVRHAQFYSHVDWQVPYRSSCVSYAAGIDPEASLGSNVPYAGCPPALHCNNVLTPSRRADITTFYNSIDVGYRGTTCLPASASCRHVTDQSRIADFHHSAVMVNRPPHSLYPPPLRHLPPPSGMIAAGCPWLRNNTAHHLQPPVAVVAPTIHLTPCSGTEARMIGSAAASEAHHAAPPTKSRSRSLDPSAVAVMRMWYARNAHHPYPPASLVAEICSRWALSADQVKKWFANKRMRTKYKKQQR